jgi:disulfide bond formation protein DsbB
MANDDSAPNADSSTSQPQPVSAQEYTDGRPLWDWPSRYPDKARKEMCCEAWTLIGLLILALAGAGLSLGMSGQDVSLNLGDGRTFLISCRLLAIFCVGTVGGITFSIKWLVHAVARGKWHVDRRYWRFMVPAIAGVYACVVITLFGEGIFRNQSPEHASMAGTAALAFLVGYFSDGVSGLLSNIANAVFGTLEKK